jgi:hypothetical protein
MKAVVVALRRTQQKWRAASGNGCNRAKLDWRKEPMGSGTPAVVTSSLSSFFKKLE